MRLKQLPALILCSVLLFPLASNAGFNEFKKNVEAEEAKNDAKSGGENDKNASSSSNSCAGNCVSSFFELSGKLIAYFWAAHNLSVNYSDYPYSGRKFISHQTEKGQRNHYYTFDFGYSGFENSGHGIRFGLRGKFWKFLGPEAESRLFRDSDEGLYLHDYGLNIALFQTEYFSADTYIQYAMMRGLLTRDGSAFGFYFSAFPFKPLFLNGRFAVKTFKHISLTDYSACGGMMINRFAVYFGHRALVSKTAKFREWQAGTMVFF